MSALLLDDVAAARMILDAGWHGEDAVTALAVSIGEAGVGPHGEIDAHARGDVALETPVWGPSIGTMQIRSLKAEKGSGTVRDELANLDPRVCYRHAHQLWAMSGWRPWSAWLHGTYRRHLDRAAHAIRAAAPATFTLGRYLYWRPGMKQSDGSMLHGEDVKAVQRAAGIHGTGPNGVDGWYGPYTEQAIIRAQRARHIADDGIVGPQTTKALGGHWSGPTGARH